MSRELQRDEIGIIRHDESRGVLELEWLDATATASDADVKAELTSFADHAEKARARFLMIDVQHFEFRWTPDIDSWRKQHILPRYDRAGVEKFAFLHPAGAAPPLAPTVETGAKFSTGHFDSRRRAEEWLGIR